MIPTELLDELHTWLADAVANEPDVPDAMQIATRAADGRLRIRTVLLKALAADGFVFYTNLGSRKANDLEADPRIAALLHWKSLQRQVNVEGTVESVDSSVADAYFATRPRGSQIGAWASHQSQPIADRATLFDAVAFFEQKFDGGAVPRPPFWSGFRIVPDRIELWQGLPSRLHERRVWTLGPSGWGFELLQP